MYDFKLIFRLVIILHIFLYAPANAEPPTDAQQLPIAPQKMDGLNGELIEAFASPNQKKFSADIMQKNQKASPPRLIPSVDSKKRTPQSTAIKKSTKKTSLNPLKKTMTTPKKRTKGKSKK